MKIKKMLSVFLSILMIVGGSFAGTLNTTFAEDTVQKVEAPVISPDSGAFSGSQNVSINCATSGVAIRYTTDGNEPTSGSTLYSGAFTINSTTTVKAKAFLDGMTDSDTASKTYTLQAANSTISSSSGNFDKNNPSDITVNLVLNGNTLSSIRSSSKTLTPGTDYTNNGSSVILKADFLKNLTAGDTTLTFAFSAGSEANFTIKVTDTVPASVAAPTANLNNGTYTGTQNIILSCATPGAEIHFTIDGTTPSSASTRYTLPISISSSKTVKAIAYKDGIASSVSTYSYVINSSIEAPTASLNSGSFDSAQSVTLKCNTPNTTIYYTANGDTPTNSPEKKYSSSILINGPTTLKAIAYYNGTNTCSSISTYTYSFDFAPTASLDSGTIITESQTVTLSCKKSYANIYYTTDGSTPSNSSKWYDSSKKITIDSDTTLKAIAYYNSNSGLIHSDVSTYKYIYLPKPKANISSGTYSSSQTISLSCSKSDAKIYYTTDGSTPSQSSPNCYNSSFTIDKNTTLKMIAYYKDSSTSKSASTGVVEYNYTIVKSIDTPVANISSGTYYSSQQVSLSCGTSGATIYYTTNGSTPNNNSTLYTANSKINIYSSTVLKTIAYYNGIASSVNTYTYVIQLSTNKFVDLENYSWAKTQIETLAQSGIIKGTSDTTFSPAANIKRADFICLLVRTLNLSSSVSSNFDDVSSSDYFYTEVGIARDLGICTGVGGNKLNPNQVITRQDMMVLVSKALQKVNRLTLTGSASDTNRFSDSGSISSYAQAHVATLVREGIIQGSGNCINPLGTATRAETAVIMYKIINKQ